MTGKMGLRQGKQGGQKGFHELSINFFFPAVFPVCSPGNGTTEAGWLLSSGSPASCLRKPGRHTARVTEFCERRFGSLPETHIRRKREEGKGSDLRQREEELAGAHSDMMPRLSVGTKCGAEGRLRPRAAGEAGFSRSHPRSGSLLGEWQLVTGM